MRSLLKRHFGKVAQLAAVQPGDPAVAQDMWDKLRLHAALAAKYEPTLWQAFWLMAQASLQEHRDLQARELLKQALSVGADRGTLEPLMEEVRFRLSKAIVNQA